MDRIRAARPSPPLAVAVLALVAALAGTAVGGETVATTSVSKKKTKQIAKKQVRKLAPRIASEEITERAPSLSVANADQLGGTAASEYVQRSELAPVPETGLALSSGWAPVNPGSGGAPPTAYRDQLGVVHLGGLIFRASGTGNVALTLPPGLRPAFELEFPVVCDVPGIEFDPRPGVAFIDPNGDVRPISPLSGYDCTERLSLDGISFRAAG